VLARVRSLVAVLLHRSRFEAAMADEMRFHMQAYADDLARDGMSPADAMRRARLEFGSVEAVREDCRQARGLQLFDELRQDFRVALRSYRRQPGFAVVVLVTLTIAIAATTATFTVVNAVLLRPLPYARADELVHVWETHERDPAARGRASYPNFLDWRAEASSVVALEGYDETNVAVSHGGQSDMTRGARVTGGFFRLLGVSPLLGRTFTADDDVGGGTRAVVLSHALWTRRFAADANAVGRPVTIDGSAYEIRGVLPPQFRFAPAGDAELWLPLGRTDEARAQRFDHWLTVVGRLRDGVTIEMAERRIADVMHRLATEYPESNAGRSVTVTPLREDIVGNVERPLVVLFVAVAFVFLIACANVASLVLARSTERARELAVRWAIGASRARVIRQLLTENLVLSVGGAVLGAWLAFLSVPLLVSAIPDRVFDQAPSLRDAAVDVTTLAFTSAVAVIAGAALGIIPGMLVSRFSVAEALRSDARVGAGRISRRLRDAIVSAEIALTLVLLVGASLMGRSLVELLRVDPGFTADGVATIRVALAGPSYLDRWRQARFFEDALMDARAIPGVATVGAISNAPLQGSGTNTFHVDGAAEPPPSARPEAATRAVAGDYFSVLHIPVREGRTVGRQDDRNAAYAVVINESLGRRLFGTRSAVGQRLRFYHWQDSAWTIVGVVGDVKTNNLDEPVRPTVYYSHLQGPANRMSIVARTTSVEPPTLIPALRQVIRKLDPTVAVYAASTMGDYVGGTQAVYRRRYMLVVLGAFAGAALLLAIIGVYGVVAYAVTQRTREIAIRVALGATGAKVVRLVMRHGLRLVILGIVPGVIAALGLSRALASLLFEVNAADLPTYAVAATLVVVVALAASYLPGRRAARFDPALSLRSE
jgi:putative ABC transport system permease protein